MPRPSPNHGTQRLPNDDDDDELRKTTTVRTQFVCTHAEGVCLKMEDLSLSISLLFRNFDMQTLKLPICVHS